MASKYSHTLGYTITLRDGDPTSSIRQGLSWVMTPSERRYVTDTSIQNLVGVATYRLLYLASPGLYIKFYPCIKNNPLFKNTTISKAEDFNSLFIDSNYGPIDLKLDLVRICAGMQPINPLASNLVGSSQANQSLNMSGWDWLIIIFVIMIVSIAFFWFLFGRDRNGITLSPSNLIKINIWK